MEAEFTTPHAESVNMTSTFTDLCRNVAKNVRCIRIARGVSQEELAHAVGVDRTYVSQIERAIGNPSLQVLHKLACALETNLATLLMESPPKAD